LKQSGVGADTSVADLEVGRDFRGVLGSVAEQQVAENAARDSGEALGLDHEAEALYKLCFRRKWSIHALNIVNFILSVNTDTTICGLAGDLPEP
jgi:hypothetical protein